MLAAFLIETGLTFDQAIEVILTANSQIELREARLNYLKALAGERSSK
ncbi:hypothetical protein [Leptolyngbya sp. FACHB-711]|nr:hypothetical protein [Leptolyngbya sp. FACHB-711]MBD1852594.1 hypothetical protein [Cyanobacteria bacterium FACHB-502]MBD2025783.1 hypothetical protein [Leptolyngbya sp. FACHB-711]